MKKVLVRGPLLSQSGYGVHSRQLYRFCESQKDWNITTQVLPWGCTPWNVSDEDEDGIYGRIMTASKPVDHKFDISFQIQLPHEWDHELAHFNVGVTAGVETDRCSPEWADLHRKKMNLIIVPSSFTKRTFEKSSPEIFGTPIEVLPEAFFPDLLQEPTEDPLAELKTDNNILMVGTLTSDDPRADRKNLINSILWSMKALKDKSGVGIVVKTSRGRDTSIDRELVRKTLKQIKRASGISEKRCPNLYMLHGPMTRQEMANLYKSPKICAYVSATRGEGFGLPLLEAAVAGLPIVATGWSAHTEFLKGPSFLSAKYDIRAIPETRVDGQIFIPGAMWAEPREGNFCRKLKQAVENRENLSKEAEKLSESLIKTHNLSVLAQKFSSIMETYLK
tara:strand:+ start:1486 stop:2661 length:1176 start_codon:yes stop_codon:yes gene_type:complete